VFYKEKLNFRIELNTPYSLIFRRRGNEIAFFVNDAHVKTLPVLPNHNIMGCHLGIGAIKEPRQSWHRGIDVIKWPPQSWDFDISSPRLHIDNNPQSADLSFRDRVHLFSVVYGEKHTDWLGRIMFPSLLLEGNLPSMQGKQICHNIYCSRDEVPLLGDYIIKAQELGIRVIVNDSIIPTREQEQKEFMHLAVLDAIKTAIAENAVMVVAMTDHVFGHGLAKVINQMRPYEYVVSGHARIHAQRSVERVPSIIESLRATQVQSNKPLVSAAMGELKHPMVIHGLNHVEQYWHAFESSGHYSVYFKEPPPLCLHPHPDLIPILLGETYYAQWGALDHDWVDYCYQRNRLKIIDNSEDFFWAELTEENTYNPTVVNDYFSDAAKHLSRHELKWHKAA
jgi:hypothetical protein